MFWLFIFLGIVIFLIIGFLLGSKELKKRNEIQTNIDNILKQNNISPSQIFASDDKKSGIVYDKHSNSISVINMVDNSLNLKTFKCEDILQSEILEDGDSLVKTSKSSAIGGVILGGLIAGGIGAIVGGLSSKKKNISEVKKIELQIVVNNVDDHLHSVYFLNKDYTFKKDSQIYKTCHSKANHWHKLLSVMIKQSEQSNQNSIIS